MIGPQYGQWWKERAATRRLRLLALLLPVLLVTLVLVFAGPVGDRVQARMFDAIDRGHTDEVQRLLALGASVDARLAGGQTLLHRALYQGHHRLALAIIDAGADVDAVDNQGIVPLHYAADSGADPVVARLIEAGADADARSERFGAPLHHAAGKGHAAAARRLLDGGASLDARDGGGSTPLHYAAGEGHAGVVEALLGGGADGDAASSLYGTPLHWAAEGGRDRVALKLLEHGASRSIRDRHGFPPHARARQRGHAGLALFLAIGADGDRRAANSALPGGESRQCRLPDRLHRVSRIFLDSYVQGDLSRGEFRRRFSLPDSALIPVGHCIVGLYDPARG